MQPKVIAIDFDGTITKDSPIPITGELRQDAIEVIKKLQNRYTCCLWTCRVDETLEEALSLLADVGITFEFVNCSPYDKTIYEPRKMIADYYIDDRIPGYVVDWREIEKVLLGDSENV